VRNRDASEGRILAMKTRITGGYIIGFNGKSHEILKDEVVVLDDVRG
jgi:hypothetical protein